MNKIVKIGIDFGAKWMANFQARFDYQILSEGMFVID